VLIKVNLLDEKDEEVQHVVHQLFAQLLYVHLLFRQHKTIKNNLFKINFQKKNNIIFTSRGG
jgi:hypothetical protein